MTDLYLDKYLDIANEEKLKNGLDKYIPLYPMLRVVDDKLCVAVILTHEDDNVWKFENKVKPEYWMLIDIKNEKVIEFNKTSEKDFANGELIPKNVENKSKEISKYSVEKTLQYKEYIENDIKNFELPLQKKLSKILGDEIDIDGEKVNINDYLFANLDADIKKKVDELVDLLIWSKYGSITFYYDILFKQVIHKYLNESIIDKDKITLCIEIMNNYYDGVVGINNLFNIGE